MKFLLKKVPTYTLIIATALGAFGSYAFSCISTDTETHTEDSVAIATNFSGSCSMSINRLAGRKFIKPLLYAENTCEAQDFEQMKGAVNSMINDLKGKGELNTASVYVRLFGRKGEWLNINDEVRYQPGSLFKVPLLITYLRLEERTPGLLKKQLTFNQITQEAKSFKQEFMKNRIQLGKSYEVNDLLKYMIVHSDNNATMLLFNNIPAQEFERTFTDLGLDKKMTASDGVVSAKEYSTFWITLYNGSYLNFDHSEYALSLLSQSDFEEGMMKGIPKNVMVAHKFGEKGNTKNHCLHETGIVYANSRPYLVTIMTEGSNQAILPDCLQKISATIYNNIEGFTK